MTTPPRARIYHSKRRDSGLSAQEDAAQKAARDIDAAARAADAPDASIPPEAAATDSAKGTGGIVVSMKGSCQAVKLAALI